MPQPLPEGSYSSQNSHMQPMHPSSFTVLPPQNMPQATTGFYPMVQPAPLLPMGQPASINGMPLPHAGLGFTPSQPFHAPQPQVPPFPAPPQANGAHDRSAALPIAQDTTDERTSNAGSEPKTLIVHAAALFLVYLPFYLLYILLFTEIGFGATFFKGLAESATWWEVVSAIGFTLLMVLYLLDISKWSMGNGKGTVRIVLILVVIFAGAVSTALTFSTRPYAPILSFLAGMCVVFAVVHKVLFKNKNLADYLESLGMSLVLWGITGLAVALIWSALNNFWWGPESQVEFRERLRICEDMTVADDGSSHCQRYGRYGVRCPAGCAEREDISACAVDQENCLAALVLWVNPFIMSISTLIVGASMHFIASQDNHGSHQPHKQNARIFILTLLLFIFIIWIAAGVSGGSGELSNMVMAFAATGLLVMFVLLGTLVGFSKAGERIVSHAIYERITGFGRSAWLHGAFVLSISIFVPPFLLLSWINKKVRIALSREEKKTEGQSTETVWKHSLTELEMTKDEHELTFTSRAHNIMNEVAKWEWTAVLSKAVWLGFFYFVVQVLVGKVTTLFLAWLNIQLANVNIWGVSAIIFLIGQGLFAIPAVPGVPAYLACGVIIGARGEVEGWSFGGTMLWAVLVAWMCKHCACLVQQKVFGEQLGNSLWVRSTLMVNSPVTKSIKLILQEPRMTLNKVYILVGGPDWPTSVLTGVLRLPVVPMQLGTTPIVLPIALTVLAGGGMLKVDEGEVWTSLSSLFLTLSGSAFAGTLLIGLVAVENTQRTKASELEAMENDKEVEKFDKEQEEQTEILEKVSKWEDQGVLWQGVLLLSVVFMYCATYLFFLAGADCFEEIEVTTDYREPPINGSIGNFIKTPMGYLGLALEATALALFFAFRKNIAARVAALKKLREERKPKPQGGELSMGDVHNLSGAMRSELATTVQLQGGIGNA